MCLVYSSTLETELYRREAGNRGGEFCTGSGREGCGRRAEVGPGQIYRWRQELQAAANGFAQVLIAPPETASARTANEAVCAEPVVEIEFAGKTRVRIPASIPVALAASIIKALAQR